MHRKKNGWKDNCDMGKCCQGIRSFDRLWEVTDHHPGPE